MQVNSTTSPDARKAKIELKSGTTLLFEERYRNSWDGSVATIEAVFRGVHYNIRLRKQFKKSNWTGWYWGSVAIYWDMKARSFGPTGYKGSEHTDHSYPSRREALYESVALAERIIAIGKNSFEAT